MTTATLPELIAMTGPLTVEAAGNDGPGLPRFSMVAYTGETIVQGDLVGVAKLDIASGALGALAVQGVFDLPKATGVGSGIDAGVKVYWDAADGQAKAEDEAGANKYLGKTIAAAGDDDATVRVRLEQ